MENGLNFVNNDGNVILLRPARPYYFHVGRKVHRVGDEIYGAVGFTIRQQLLSKVGPRFEAVMIRSDGQGAFIPAGEWQREVDSERREWLRDLCVKANEKCAGPGFWIFAWADANKPDSFVGLWFDDDGDLQCLMDEESRPFRRMKAFGIDSYVSNCALALQTWAEEMAKLELEEDQRIKAAQGQTRPN